MHTREQGPAHLPANARGALYHAFSSIEQVAQDGNDILIASRPKPIAPTMFAVTDDRGETLGVVLEPVSGDASDSANNRYLYSSDANVRACARGQDTASCKRIGADPDQSGWLAQLLKARRVQDVTKRLAQSEGLFRVGPAGGFKQGHSYRIKRLARNPGDAYASEIRLKIDAPLVLDPKLHVSLVPDGVPVRQMVSVPAGSMCSARIPAAVQNLRYVLPATLAAYRESLVFDTEQAYQPGGFNPFDQAVGQFQPWTYVSSVCESIPFGASAEGPGLEKVYAACDNSGKPLVSSRVRGEVRFLELSDRAYAAPEMEVRFRDAKPDVCSQQGFLEQALRSGNAKAIDDAICDLKGGRDEASPQARAAMIRDVSPFMQSKDARAATCARQAAYTLYLQLAEPVWADRTQHPMSTEERAVLNDATLVKSLLLAQLAAAIRDDKDPMVQLAASQGVDRLARVIWDSPSLAQLANNRELLDTAIAAARKLLSMPDDVSRDTAYELLAHLGPRAASLLPTLLQMAAAPQKVGSSGYLAGALAAVAPRDARVFAALANWLSESSSIGVANELVHISAGREQEVVATLVKALQNDNGNSYEIMQALASMGDKAKAARPALFKQAQSVANRESGLEALLSIGDRSPATLDLICQTMLKPPARRYDPNSTVPRESMIYLVARFGRDGEKALPTVAKVMSRPISSNERYALKNLFDQLELTDTEKAAWLAKLDKVPSSD